MSDRQLTDFLQDIIIILLRLDSLRTNQGKFSSIGFSRNTPQALAA
jgi:hypothetical protein